MRVATEKGNMTQHNVNSRDHGRRRAELPVDEKGSGTATLKHESHKDIKILRGQAMLGSSTQGHRELGGDRLRCAIRGALIHRLLTSIENLCDLGTEDELGIVCDVLARWRHVRRTRTSLAPLLTALLSVLRATTCAIHSPTGKVKLIASDVSFAENTQPYEKALAAGAGAL